MLLKYATEGYAVFVWMITGSYFTSSQMRRNDRILELDSITRAEA